MSFSWNKKQKLTYWNPVTDKNETKEVSLKEALQDDIKRNNSYVSEALVQIMDAIESMNQDSQFDHQKFVVVDKSGKAVSEEFLSHKGAEYYIETKLTSGEAMLGELTVRMKP